MTSSVSVITQARKAQHTHILTYVVGYNFEDCSPLIWGQQRPRCFGLVHDLAVSSAEISVPNVGVIGQVEIHNDRAGLAL